MTVRSTAFAESAPVALPGQERRYRILGTLGMLGSPFLFFSLAANGFAPGDSNQLGAVLGLLFAVGWLGNVLGLRALRVTGTSMPARGLLALQVVTVTLAGIFQVYEFAAPGADSLLYHITDVAWPLSMLLLLLTGIAALRARTFEGWLRFTPLLAALWLPLGIAEMAAIGETAGQAVGGLHTAFGWFLIGYAVLRGGRLSSRV